MTRHDAKQTIIPREDCAEERNLMELQAERDAGLRVVTLRDATSTRLGVVRAGRVVDLARAARLAGAGDAAPELHEMLALIRAGGEARERVRQLAEQAPADAVRDLETIELLAPIPRPARNIFCVGRNYAEHDRELTRTTGQAVTVKDLPNIFTKADTTVSSPYGDVPIDASISTAMDWEVELGVVIGRGGRHIAEADALAHVWGYTVFNDVTARDIQHQGGIQWFLGKNLDGTFPMGPLIVTTDGIPDPQTLRLRCAVNGVVKQDATTAQMIFPVARLVAALSRLLTLQAGDLIATGTPSGVGFARTPPEFLRPGDTLSSTVERVGTLRNRIVAARDAPQP